MRRCSSARQTLTGRSARPAARLPPTRAARARSPRRASAGGRRAARPRGRRAGAGRSPRLSISGPISAVVLAGDHAATRLAIGVTVRRLKRIVGRPSSMWSRDPLDQLAVGDHLRAADVERLAADLVAGGGAGQQLDHVALVDRGWCGASARPARRAPASARPGGRGTGTSVEPAPITIEARKATEHGVASSRIRSTASRLARCGETRAAGWDQAAQVDDPLHPGRPAAARAKFSAAARSRTPKAPSPRAPSSGSGSRRPRRRRAPARAPRR